MDDIDSKIIEVLSENSRISFKDLSKKLKISDVAVKKRVDKLCSSGLIEKFTIDVDQKKLGKEILAYVLIKAEANKARELSEQISKLKGVCEVFTTMGEYEIIVKIYINGINELRQLVEDEIALMQGIIELKTNIVFSEY